MKVLVVDDSALMRRLIKTALQADGFEVLTARDGEDALAQLCIHEPDCITLDINMPKMDGLECLSRIMTQRPTPVVMVSSLTAKGAMSTLEALAMGATDFICKPGGTVSLNMNEILPKLCAKVRAAVGSKQRDRSSTMKRAEGQTSRQADAKAGHVSHRRASARPGKASIASGCEVVLVGVSTGGPRVIELLLKDLPTDFQLPVVICQHMPSSFTSVFTNRLNGLCQFPVVEVTSQRQLEPNTVFIGRGDADIVFTKRGTRTFVSSAPSDARYNWHPSVDRMVYSALDVFDPHKIIGVQLTGMGDDGAAAFAELQQRGGETIAESSETATIFGMPKALIELDGANHILRDTEIAGFLASAVQGRGTPRRTAASHA